MGIVGRIKYIFSKKAKQLTSSPVSYQTSAKQPKITTPDTSGFTSTTKQTTGKSPSFSTSTGSSGGKVGYIPSLYAQSLAKNKSTPISTSKPTPESKFISQFPKKITATKDKFNTKEFLEKGGTQVGGIERPKPKPSQIGLIPDEDIGGARLNLGGAFFLTGKKIVQRFTSKPGTGPSFGEITAPLDLTVKPKVSQEALILSYGDIISGEKLTERQKSLAQEFGIIKERTTFGAVQRGREKERDIQLGFAKTESKKELTTEFEFLQGKINTGELTLKTAEQRGKLKFEDVSKKFKVKQEDIIGGFKDIPGIRQPQRAEGLRMGLDIGAFITTGGASEIIGGARSLQQEPIVFDIGAIKSGDLSIEGAKRQTPGLGTTLQLSAGVLSVGGLGLTRAGKGATEVRVESALQSIKERPIKLFSQQFRVEKEFLDVGFFGGKGDFSVGLGGFATRTAQKSARVRALGQLDTTVISREFFSGKPFIISETQLFGARGGVIGIGDSASLSIQAVKSSPFSRKTISAFGKRPKIVQEFFDVPKQLKGDLIGGISVRQGDFIKGISGRINQLGFETVTGPGFKQMKGIDLGFPVETISRTKVSKPKLDSGIKIIKGGGRIPSLFETPSLTSQQVSKTSEAIARQAIKDISISLPKGVIEQSIPLLGIPRAVGGEGLTESQLLAGRRGSITRGSLVEQQLGLGPSMKGPQPIGKLAPEFDLLGNQGTFIKPVQLGTSKTRGGFKPITSTRAFSLNIPFLDTFQQPTLGLKEKQLQKQPQLIKQILLQEETFTSFKPITTPFSPKLGRGFGGFALPILLPPKLDPLLGKIPNPKRIFKRTPSFAALHLGSLGFKLPKATKSQEQSGLFERIWKGTPQNKNLLGNVFTIKRNKRGKVKKNRK